MNWFSAIFSGSIDYGDNNNNNNAKNEIMVANASSSSTSTSLPSSLAVPSSSTDTATAAEDGEAKEEEGEQKTRMMLVEVVMKQSFESSDATPGAVATPPIPSGTATSQQLHQLSGYASSPSVTYVEKNNHQQQQQTTSSSLPIDYHFPLIMVKKYVAVETNKLQVQQPPRIPSSSEMKRSKVRGVSVSSGAGKGHSLGASTHIGGKDKNQDISFCIGLKTGYDSSIAVFDGHGKYGRQIARNVHDYFIRKVVDIISPPKKAPTEPHADSPPRTTIAKLDLHKELIQQFLEIERIVCADTKTATRSGTTATIALQKDGKMFVAYTGDSRAVLASNPAEIDVEHGINAKRLTIDHRFDIESEYNMVIRAGGTIRAREGKYDGALRVWLSDDKARELGVRSPAPGLMVSRSIGDYYAKVAGCSATPDVVSFDISANDKFLVVASDGLWDILSDLEAVEFVNRLDHARDVDWAKTAAEKLIAHALNKSKQMKFISDNITVAIMDLEKCE